jgi:Putative transmembrane protein (PGPGW)
MNQPNDASSRQQSAPQPPPERSFGSRLLRNSAGALLVVAGIAGLFLPILQGVLMIVGGLALIDLPIKHKAHARLLRYSWYRWLTARHDQWLEQWRAHRQRKRRERDASEHDGSSG